jgi:heterodisulfide reductase subunit A-like polyferredoxin
MCPFDAIQLEKSDEGLIAVINDLKCKRCGLCVTACPAGAVTIKDSFLETVANAFASL